MNNLENYLIPINEGYLFNENTIYLNIDKWKNGEINTLYITGLSGSGKGYVARQYAKDRADVTTIELDKFENYTWYRDYKEENENVARGDKIILKYMKNRFGDLSIDVFNNDVEKYHKEMKLFIEYLREYMKNNPFVKFIIEGIQIYLDNAFNFLDNTYPIIVIRTSMVKSMRKVMDRKHCTFRNRLHTFMDFQKKLKDFVERLDVDTAMISNEASLRINANKADFKTPENLLEWMKKNFKYSNFTRMKSIGEMLLYPRGSCHDQTHFVSYFLGNMKLQNGQYFMIESNTSMGGETHSFAWFKRNNKYYWFENAWESQRGIHEFNSLRDMTNYMRNMHRIGKWGNSKKYPTFQITPFRYQEKDTLQQMINRMYSPR